MKVGDLVKTKDFEQYGIITEIVDIHALCLWYVVLRQCGSSHLHHALQGQCIEQGRMWSLQR